MNYVEDASSVPGNGLVDTVFGDSIHLKPVSAELFSYAVFFTSFTSVFHIFSSA
jgi:hypothetical protein